ncbi:hypothetical protein G7Y89_g13535 [Cudoniella acicularis]|uniref:Uncharacterized protein n=1 Tax=Cudoniella acicularis TaxID=354080 RepID=A0A8H4R727_9HELO|nr:hypothetical protein G7Y89_g13535 [Cudoniella acicularis]
MGWFDAGKSSHSHDKHRRSSSRHQSTGSLLGALSGTEPHRSSSRHRSSGSIFGGGDSHKHNSSRSSLFGGDPKRNSSRSSFFGGFGGGGRSSSHYKRSPRDGFVKRVYAKLRRLLRDLMYYMKRNPMKVFMLVIMPLITGGALTGLMRKFGIRMPPALQKMFGGGAGIGQGRNGSSQYGRSSEGPMGGMSGGMGGLGSAMGAMGGIGSAMKVAKMFM